jgi:serine/threonine protein kinase
MAPELFGLRPEPTVRSDIYSAGATLYRMLTGAYPYGKVSSSGRPPRGEYMPATRLRAEIPEALDRVLTRACALDPEERYETAQEFAEALDAAMAQQAPVTVTKKVKAKEKPDLAPEGRRSGEIIAIAGLAVVLVLYLIFVLRG